MRRSVESVPGREGPFEHDSLTKMLFIDRAGMDARLPVKPACPVEGFEKKAPHPAKTSNRPKQQQCARHDRD
jgi:hypothetical protein